MFLIVVLFAAGSGSAGVGAGDVAVPLALEALDGERLWEARYDGPASASDWGRAVAVHPQGLFVFVTGNSQATSADFATVAYEATTGLPVWVARYDGPEGRSDFPNAIGVSPDGARVYVAGYQNSATTSNDVVTVAYDALTGLQLWATVYDGPAGGSDVPYDLAVDPAGERVYITGGSAGSGTSTDYLTLAYDALTGGIAWESRYDGPVSGFDIPWGVAVSPEGDALFVTGQSRGASADIVTIAYEATTGVERWLARHDGPAASVDNANDVAVHPDGDRVFVGGYTRGGTTSNDLTVIAHDAASGAEIWVSRYDGPASGADYAQAIAVDPLGERVYATGYSWGGSATRADWPILAFDATSGARVWEARHDGPTSGLDAGQALAASRDGERLYVTGYSTDANNDFALLAFDAAAGEEIWQQRYDGPGAGIDYPRGLAVDPLELRVYVTGNSAGQGTNNDFATLAVLDRVR